MPTTPRTEESIFAEALEKQSPEERAAFVDGACGHDDDLSGRDPRAVHQTYPPSAVKLIVESRQRALTLRGRPDGSERIILARRCEAEDREDRVSDDLLDDSAMRLQDQPHLVEIQGENLYERFLIELFAEGSRVLEVREDDRYSAMQLLRCLTGPKLGAAVTA